MNDEIIDEIIQEIETDPQPAYAIVKLVKQLIDIDRLIADLTVTKNSGHSLEWVINQLQYDIRNGLPTDWAAYMSVEADWNASVSVIADAMARNDKIINYLNGLR